MKKQSEWMKGLLAAESNVKQKGFYYTKRWYLHCRVNEGNFDFVGGVREYLENYQERNNV